MSQAITTRGNLWLVLAVAGVAALLLLSVTYLVATQLGLMHVIAVMFQAPPQKASLCPGGILFC
jgi:hypothetical protein